MTSTSRPVAAALVIGVVLGVFVPVLGLNPTSLPFEHRVCVQTSGGLASTTVWVPELLVNSPYGGSANGSNNQEGIVTPTVNGAAYWLGDLENLSISVYTNDTSYGAGPDQPCASSYRVQLQAVGLSAAGFPIMGPGNLSDLNEPHQVNLSVVWDPPVSGIVTFNNGFSRANSAAIDTCAGTPVEVTSQSSYLTLFATFRSGESNVTIPFNSPYPYGSEHFHYWFPGGGIWEVDNLSAAGGPGGGLAFSYEACP